MEQRQLEEEGEFVRLVHSLVDHGIEDSTIHNMLAPGFPPSYVDIWHRWVQMALTSTPRSQLRGNVASASDSVGGAGG